MNTIHATDVIKEQLEAGLALSETVLEEDGIPEEERAFQGTLSGVTRPGYSEAETRMMRTIADEARGVGAETFEDVAGNLYFVYPGQDRNKPVKLMGSHVDSVDNGGRYDGAVGAVLPLAVMQMMHRAGVTPPQDLVGVVWRCEESPTFGTYGIGSGLATAALNLSILDSKRNSAPTNLYDAIGQSYLSDTDKGSRLCALRYDDSPRYALLPARAVAEAIEFHIEQHDTLLRMNKSLGIAECIRGHVRFPKIELHGKHQHSGAGTMAERADSSVLLMDFMAKASAILRPLEKKGDLVYTFPIIRQPNKNRTSVPNFTEIAFEARSSDPVILSAVHERMSKMITRMYRKPEEAVLMDKSVCSKPTVLSASTNTGLYLTVQDVLGFDAPFLRSGPGHDVARLVKCGVPSSLVLIRHNGLSHEPGELLGRTLEEDPYRPDGDYANALRLAANIAMTPLTTLFQARNDRSGGPFVAQLRARGAVPVYVT